MDIIITILEPVIVLAIIGVPFLVIGVISELVRSFIEKTER